jgi:hypothetical protein
MKKLKYFHGRKIEITLLAFALFLVALRVYQIRFIPFGSPDDTAMAATSFTHGGLWPAALAQAESQGRFYQVIFTFLTQLPYHFINHNYLWSMIGLQVIALNFALYFSIKSILKERIFAISSLIFFNTLFDFRGGYNSINSFPFWFCFSLILFLFSIKLISLAHSNKSSRKIRFLRGSAYSLCLFASLAYESLLFFPLLLLVLDYRFWSEYRLIDFNKQNAVRFLKKQKVTISYILVFYLMYFICYISFRMSNPNNYPGVKISFSDPIVVILTVIRMTVAGFNSPWYFSQIDIPYFVKENLYEFCIFALVFGLISHQLQSRVKKSNLKLIPILVACVVALLPNSLYGLTERYREIAVTNPLYLGALFSAPAIIFILLNSMSLLLGKNGLLTHFFIFFGSLIFAMAATINNINIHNYGDQIRSRNITWAMVNELTNKPATVKFGEKLVVKDLNNAINTHESYGYWAYYISSRLNQKIDVGTSGIPENSYSTVTIIRKGELSYLLFFTFSPTSKVFTLSKILTNDINSYVAISYENQLKNFELTRKGKISRSKSDLDLIVEDPSRVTIN